MTIPSSDLQQCHINEMLKAGIIRKIDEYDVPEGVASVLFLVPEEGKRRRRVVVDTVTENVFASPQKFVFRPLERLFEVVATAEYAMVYDFKAYFYQFKLEDAVQPYFSFRKDQRFYCFTRLPMGFSKAVAVAQITTETLAKMACEDLFNVLFLGSRPTLELIAKRFESYCAQFGVTIGSASGVTR